ncbi:MAG TPA: YbaK/EbsC family protein [Bryobacteraceae bacterium]|nr:YbaK/EbsC family protein [Bryobacteraceae bacterium]
MSASAHKVQQTLDAAGVTAQVKEMPATTRTAKEAAAAIGCSVAQIAKSLVFRTESGQAVLVVASGANRVNESVLADLVGESIEKATPDFVREATGYAIGGVPPIGHAQTLNTWFDDALLDFDLVWAAAGTPFNVFAIEPTELIRITGGKSIRLERAKS